MNNQPSHLLDKQLNLLDQQTARWQLDHQLALLCCDIEDFFALALETLDRIRKRHTTQPADTVMNYFRRWHGICLKAIPPIEFVEQAGFRPERSDEFRFALNEASIAVDADKVIAAQERLKAGRGQSLDGILHGISGKA